MQPSSVSAQKTPFAYQLTQKECQDQDMGQYLSYGVRVFDCAHSCCRMEISDITLSKAMIIEFIDKLNDMQLSPIHFQEAVADFIEALS